MKNIIKNWGYNPFNSSINRHTKYHLIFKDPLLNSYALVANARKMG